MPADANRPSTGYSIARRSPRASLLLLAVAWAGAANANPAELEAAREQFLRAYAAAQGLAAEPPPDSDLLRAYPLYPYLQAARIARSLIAADDGPTPADEHAARFLDRHGGEPVGRELRRVWLRSLGRRQQWESLLANHRTDTDPALNCQSLQARIAVQGDDADSAALHAEAVERWLTPYRLPVECEPVFEWMRQSGRMTDALIEQRARGMLRNGEASFARVVARRLPTARSAPLLAWAELIEQPRRAVDRWIRDPDADVEPDALLDGWARLARQDPAAALERYEPLLAARRLDRQQASLHARALALGLAWDRRPEALEYFERIAAEHRDDYTLGWEARSALWAGDWATVEAALASMSPDHAGQPRWRYWAARAAERRGDRRGAERLYASVLGHDNYYSAVAAARLDRPAEPHPAPLPVDARTVRRLERQPRFVRARELLLCDLRTRAVYEWLDGFDALSAGEREQTIHVAASWGWHDMAVVTATRQDVFFDYELLYPQPYDREVEAAVEPTDLDIPLVYAVIRQESLFRPDAVSPAGAVGLAQLLPETARRTARRWDQPTPSYRNLLEPAVSVRLGALHLHELLERFDGQLSVALAGYNAGANAAERWLPRQPLEADVWIENIPYNETREYVQRVLWHSIVFGWLRSGEGQRVRALTANVMPLDNELLVGQIDRRRGIIEPAVQPRQESGGTLQ